MNFNAHSDLAGQHAFLGASKYHWINYDDDKLDVTYKKMLATQRGTRLHDLARELISIGIKLPKTKNTLNMYVNDGIGYKMIPEQTLYYSENCFGTADTISFRQKLLRIHDLKTGETPASMHQLEVYGALFCLEYRINPDDIGMEFRLYQSNEIIMQDQPQEEVKRIMDKIIMFDKRIAKMKIGE